MQAKIVILKKQSEYYESKNIIAKEQGRQSDYYESKNMIGKELDLEITAYQMISSYLQYVHNTLNK